MTVQENPHPGFAFPGSFLGMGFPCPMGRGASNAPQMRLKCASNAPQMRLKKRPHFDHILTTLWPHFDHIFVKFSCLKKRPHFDHIMTTFSWFVVVVVVVVHTSLYALIWSNPMVELWCPNMIRGTRLIDIELGFWVKRTHFWKSFAFSFRSPGANPGPQTTKPSTLPLGYRYAAESLWFKF